MCVSRALDIGCDEGRGEKKKSLPLPSCRLLNESFEKRKRREGNTRGEG